MSNKQNYLVDFLEDEIRPFIQRQNRNPYLHLPDSPDHFFEYCGFPDCHDYSNYFKSRLLELASLGIVRADSFAQELVKEIAINSGKSKGKLRMKVPERVRLNCLRPYEVFHHHIEGHFDSQLHNYITAIKNLNIQSYIYDRDVHQSVEQSLVGKRTGHWVLFVIRENRRLYLDVVQHPSKGYLGSQEYDADEYLRTIGLDNYRAEFPDLFPVGN
ncbi:hypothetical protein [Vibrio fluvialis]|uniref:hypothetical protein n=1 Tax=Vibrio fluvialis TaxID=676 RepID=UPI0013023A1B|nr:hypothetical protein [Vibrio fluvialis]